MALRRSPHPWSEMAARDFDRWADRACGYIYYPADREDIKTELRWHFEDAAEALTADGMSGQEAEKAALEAMGSPDELGKMLRRVHKPWLGWLHFASVLLLTALIFVFLVRTPTLYLHGLRNEITQLRSEPTTFANSDCGRSGAFTLLSEFYPSGEAECGDYTLSVSGGWVMDNGYKRMLVLVVEYSSPRFWLGPPLGLGQFSCVVENDGTAHLPYEYDHRLQDLDHWHSNSSTAIGEYFFMFPVDDVPEWVELRFDNGKSFTLRSYAVEGGRQ